MGIINKLLGNELIIKTVETRNQLNESAPQLAELLKAINAKGSTYNPVMGDLESGMEYSSLGNQKSKTVKETNYLAILKHKQVLRQFSETIIVQSILRTRKNQVVPYLRRARFSNTGLGYEIKRKDGALPTTPQEKNNIRKIEDFIHNTGKHSLTQRDTFVEFTKKFIDELYINDQVNVEFITDKNGKLDHFNILDGATIVVDDVPRSIDTPRTFVQYDKAGREIAKFSEDELSFYVNNPTTTIDHKGYGNSAVETAMGHLQYYSDTEQFNARFFSQGGTTKGMLLIDYGEGSAQASQASLHALRQQWSANFSGNNGAWKIPVMTGKDAKFVNMSQSSKDMEFESWLNYLINIVCSAFAINPEEINFPNRGGSTGKGTGNTINEGSTMKSKLDNSKQKGLQPLLQSIEDFINQFIIPRVDDKYYFQFTLGSTVSEKEQIDVILQKLDAGMLIDEARALMGLPPLPDDKGQVYGPSGSAINFLTMEQNIKQEQSATQSSDDSSKEITPKVGDNGLDNPDTPDMDTEQPNNAGAKQKIIQQKNSPKNKIKEEQKVK